MTLKVAAGVDRQRLRADLFDACLVLGLSLSDTQADKLLAYLDLLERWNRTYNLTSIRDLPGMLGHHVVDCLSVIGPLQRRLGESQSRDVLDVGSGGGLPGLIIAVMDSRTTVTCVDAVGKKTAFVQQAAASLQLDNLRVAHSRVEDLAAGPFDVVVSRAFSSLANFSTVTRRLLREGGAWMAMKGKNPDDEISVLPDTVEVFHVEQLGVPGDVGERCLVWMQLNK